MTASAPSPDSFAGANEAAARSELYRLLAWSFKFPSAEFLEAVKSGKFSATLGQLLHAASLTDSLVHDDLRSLAGYDGGLDSLCAEYIRIFEVGGERPKPLCPLYGGEYSTRPRLGVMEELVRFYGYFDLSLSDCDREMPDHICVELEFLHYLAFREAQALDGGRDFLPLRRAQADFLERHPGASVPRMRERLDASGCLPFFRELVSLAAAIILADLAHLRAQLGPG